MKHINGTKHSFNYYVSLLALFFLMAAIFFTISNAVRQQKFNTLAAALPPNAQLPSEATCASQVVKTPERISSNQQPNNTNVYASGYRLTGSLLAQYGGNYESRVTGNFTGTTDEILQWGACKWGFEADTAKAIAAGLTKWQQGAFGDCNNQGQIQPETNGCQSVGIMRVKSATIPPAHPGTWPHAKVSTAFNVDYALANIRACFDGKQTSLGAGYAAGDEAGCIGAWYSGAWHDGSAEAFSLGVQEIKTNKEWETPDFFTIAPCPTCNPPSQAPVGDGTVNPTGSVINPTGGVNPGDPNAAPCTAGDASLAHGKKKSKHWKPDGGVSGLMEALIRFFIELINLLLKLIGGTPIDIPSEGEKLTPPNQAPQVPNNPDPNTPQNPIPCEPNTPPSSAPSMGTQQPSTTVPSGGAPIPPSGTVPSGTPGGSNENPTTATCGGSANTPSSPVTGYTIKKCEDFNGTTTPSGWSLYGGGSGGSTVVGRGRQEEQCTFGNGFVTLTQDADGATCGMSSDFAQKYGYWEARMRAYTTGSGTGSAPHPVMLLWPDTGNWSDGELDWVETDIGDDGIGVFFHCTTGDPSQNCYHTTHKVDITQWHTYGFEWTATSLRGFVDGVQIYETDGAGGNPSVSMHQTLQLDNNTGQMPPNPGKMEVDWVHMYSK